MAPPTNKDRWPVMEVMMGFVLGAIAGCALGATEGPINVAMEHLTSGSHLKVVTKAVRDVGPLGVGTLLGATALTTTMVSAVTGVTIAALVALVLLRARGHENGSSGVGALVWVTSGLAAALGATGSGATLGLLIELLTKASGPAGLLWGLVAFAMLVPVLRAILRLGGDQECCGLLELGEASTEREERWQEAMEDMQRQRVAVEMEQRIMVLEEEGGEGEEQHRPAWEAQWRERKEAEREEKERLALKTEKRSVSKDITKVLLKYVDFLAFSGIPMTVTAAVTTGFGLSGFGEYRFVFVILLALVLAMAFLLMRSAHLSFWKFAGCMGMFATFAIAVLTVHAGQEVAAASARMKAAGRPVPREVVIGNMGDRASLEAVAASVFVAKLAQVGLGATVGGPLGRQVDGKIVLGATGAAMAILGLVQVSTECLGVGGMTGALLGAVGAAGVSLGSAAAIAVGWSTWAGTVATTAGIVTGALATGKWDVPNLIQVPVAYMFAMTPY